MFQRVQRTVFPFLVAFTVFLFYSLTINYNNTNVNNNRNYGYLKNVDDEVKKVEEVETTILQESESEKNDDASQNKAQTAYEIVMKSYNETFAALVEHCHNKTIPMQSCISDFYTNDQRTTISTSNDDDESKEEIAGPWFFRTMLRDSLIRQNGLPGYWHFGHFKQHGESESSESEDIDDDKKGVSMCIIEKNGSTQWRKVIFALNGGNNKFVPPKSSATNRIELLQEYPSFVFIRDPLERFLSAYIDKCVTDFRRTREKHCEPNILYNENYNNGDGSNNNENKINKEIMEGFDHHEEKLKKITFEQYVDTIPLKWNLHFFPQSLYCDGLFRHLNNMDFVGHMNSQFLFDIEKVSERYGTRFQKEVDRVFQYSEKIEKMEQHFQSKITSSLEKEQQTNNKYYYSTATTTSSSSSIPSIGNNVGVETQAPKHVKEYYSPRTVKRVLEYVSIDYVMLDLPIPQWADEILGQQ